MPSSTPSMMRSHASISRGSSRCGRASGRTDAGIVADERRLDQGVLDQLLEQLEHDLPVSQSGLQRDLVLARYRAQRLDVGIDGELCADSLRDRLVNGHRPPRRRPGRSRRRARRGPRSSRAAAASSTMSRVSAAIVS